MNDIGWGNPKFAYNLYLKFIKDIKEEKIKKYYIKSCFISLNRFSINCFAYFGIEFKNFKGNVIGDEEEYLTVNLPYKLGKYNFIFGEAVCSHFSFWTQEDYLLKTKLLNAYIDIAKKNTVRKKILEELGAIDKKEDKNIKPKITILKDKKFYFLNKLFKKKYIFFTYDYGYKIIEKIRKYFLKFDSI